MPTPDLSAIEAALATVKDPEIHRPITEIGMLKGVEISGGTVKVGVFLTISGCPMRETITERVVGAVSKVPHVTEVLVELDVMSEEQRAELKKLLSGGGDDREIPF